jgi:hypothetical protein
MRLLRLVGHVNPSNRRNRIRHSYLFSFRRLPSNCAETWASFYKGESALAMEELILNLLENSGARRRPTKVQEHLDELKRFWKHEALMLARVRKATGFTEWPVPQYQRDLVFLSYRAGVKKSSSGPREGMGQGMVFQGGVWVQQTPLLE